ncbi:YunC family protein [Paenibacillus thailandensis]|uniref:YunC family protein n=1 Tax=Paenibacillus thailandensis TaxID=393250 RepID=A0ABW5QSC1_9BACL
MMQMVPVTLDNGAVVLGIEVKLPKTTLVVLASSSGYIMCGALDVGLLNERLKDRGIIAGRAVGVRTITELLEAPLESVTHMAETLGITTGMKGADALKLMVQAEKASPS